MPYPAEGNMRQWHQTDPDWQANRILDPVRAAALVAAVNLRRHHKQVSTDEVLKIAEEFERYLTGTND